MVISRVVERLAEDKVKPELATSAGIAVYPKDGSTPTTLLSAADRALSAVTAHMASAIKGEGEKLEVRLSKVKPERVGALKTNARLSL